MATEDDAEWVPDGVDEDPAGPVLTPAAIERKLRVAFISREGRQILDADELTDQADVVPVGVGHDRVLGTPEGVKSAAAGLEASRSQLGMAVIDRLMAGGREPEDHPSAGLVGAPAGMLARIV